MQWQPSLEFLGVLATCWAQNLLTGPPDSRHHKLTSARFAFVSMSATWKTCTNVEKIDLMIFKLRFDRLKLLFVTMMVGWLSSINLP